MSLFLRLCLAEQPGFTYEDLGAYPCDVSTNTMPAVLFGDRDTKLNSDSLSASRVDSNPLATISLRAVSSDPVCRICQDVGTNKNKLISPCHCAGSMGYFHVICLEIWLAQSASNSCEVCSFEFETVRKSKPLREVADGWLRSPHSYRERRYVWADLGCFLLLTPLGAVSSWLCVSGAWQYYKDGDHWTGFGLIFLTSFLAIMYLLWGGLTLRYHVQSFKKWRLENQDVRLVVNSNGSVTTCATNVVLEPESIDCRDENATYETVVL